MPETTYRITVNLGLFLTGQEHSIMFLECMFCVLHDVLHVLHREAKNVRWGGGGRTNEAEVPYIKSRVVYLTCG
jgi:hypothetical protein